MIIYYFFVLFCSPLCFSGFEPPFWWFLLCSFSPELALGCGEWMISSETDGEWLVPYSIQSCVNGEGISSPLRCFAPPLVWQGKLRDEGYSLWAKMLFASRHPFFICTLPSLTPQILCHAGMKNLLWNLLLSLTSLRAWITVLSYPIIPNLYGVSSFWDEMTPGLRSGTLVQLSQFSSNLRR